MSLIEAIRWLLISVSLVATASVSLVASAQPTTSVNGCGTGWNRYLVPDRIKIIGCEFKPACDAHDVCYGACQSGNTRAKEPQCEYLRCEPGGDLNGKEVCENTTFRRLRIAAANRRAMCDAQFLVKLQEINPENPKCTLFTALYPFAVRVLGGQAFLGADSLDTQYSEEDKRKYAGAINQLFEKWSPEKIRKFESDFKAGKLQLDMTKPIQFDVEKGLVNIRKN